MQHNTTTLSFLNAPLGGAYLAPKWNDLYKNYSEMDLFIFGTFIVQFVAFWTPALSYLFIDLYKPHFFYKYKIQDVVPTAKLLRKCAAVVLFNQFCVAGPLLWLAYPFMKKRGMHLTSVLPSPVELFRDIFVFVLVEEVMFYYSHRLFHAKPFYKRIHKLHHQFTAPVSMAAEYAHPIEHMFSNIMPLIAGPLLMGSHLATLWIWLTMGLLSTTTSHSGYDTPVHRGFARFHDLHHEKFTVCFGVLGFLDWLHGTDLAFKKRYGGIQGTTKIAAQRNGSSSRSYAKTD